MSFDQITQQLSKTFSGQADVAANTFEGRMARLRLTFEDVRDSLAERLLPFLEQFINFLFERGIPALDGFIAGLSGENSVTAGITEATEGAFKFGEQIRSTIEFVIMIKDELLILGGIIATVFVANKIVAFVSAIMTLVTAMNTLRNAAAAAGVATAFATGGASVGLGAAALAGAAATYGLTQIAPSGSKSSLPSVPKASGTYTTGQGVTNITVNAIDSESAARAVTKALNESAARSNPYLSRAAVKK
jgi:hypothetical protein